MSQTGEIYLKKDSDDKVILSVDAIKVPGGLLYVTAHHGWGVMNTVFVKSENIIKEPKAGCPEKIWDFLGPKEEKEAESEH